MPAGPLSVLASVERAAPVGTLLVRCSQLAQVRAAMVRAYAAGPKSEAVRQLADILDRERALHLEAAALLEDAAALLR